MPFANEHAARLKDPDQYDGWARENDAFGSGIHAIYGIKENGEKKSELQAIRFSASQFTVAEAKAWLKEHDYSPILFEEASGGEGDERAIDASQVLHREMALERGETNDKELTMDISISSEQPVEMDGGFFEILDHSPEAIDLSRMNDGAPFLVNHEGEPVGAFRRGSVRISHDRKLRGTVLFSNSQRGRDIYDDMKRDIRANTSVGYRVFARRDEGNRNGMPVVRSTRWMPVEGSTVSVGRDHTVGVKRGNREAASNAGKEPTVDKEVQAAGTATATETPPKTETRSESKIEVGASPVTTRSVLEIEQTRKQAIENICKANKLDVKYRDYWIGAGLSIEQVSEDLLKILEERGKTNPDPPTKIGLSASDVRRFSLIRAIQACATKDWTNAPFELEASREIAKRMGKIPAPERFFVPYEVLERPVRAQRDLTAAVDAAGGYLVQTENIGFIEMLRNRSVAFRMGARRLSGLQGDVAIPKMTISGTATWLASEAATITESTPTFAQVLLTPKNVGGYSEISRQLLLQASPGAEGIVTDDLAQVVALAADLGVLNGSGAAGQPTGILNTAGIGTVVGTSLAYAGILEFQTDVAGNNVTPLSGGYVTTPAVVGLLMARSRFANTDTPLWVGNVWDGQVSGFPGMSSNQMPAATMLFGDWSEVVVAEWGVLQVEVNPYANFQAGIVGVRAIYSMDVGVRRAFAFSAATTIT